MHVLQTCAIHIHKIIFQFLISFATGSDNVNNHTSYAASIVVRHNALASGYINMRCFQSHYILMLQYCLIVGYHSSYSSNVLNDVWEIFRRLVLQFTPCILEIVVFQEK